jgi:hypothetical protein
VSGDVVPDELRCELAAERGLAPAAAVFLTGESVEELERSADALAEFVTAHRDPEPKQTDPLAAALMPGANQRRQRELALLLSGRARRRDARAGLPGVRPRAGSKVAHARRRRCPATLCGSTTTSSCGSTTTSS